MLLGLAIKRPKSACYRYIHCIIIVIIITFCLFSFVVGLMHSFRSKPSSSGDSSWGTATLPHLPVAQIQKRPRTHGTDALKQWYALKSFDVLHLQQTFLIEGGFNAFSLIVGSEFPSKCFLSNWVGTGKSRSARCAILYKDSCYKAQTHVI